MKCDLDRVLVNYEVRGHGRPAIFLHGFWTDHRQIVGCMEPVFAQRKGWQRFYPDLPGMGQTPGEMWINNADRMLDVVCDFIDAIIPGQRFLLGGYSYGGYLARGVLRQKLEQIDGLLLVCPAITAKQSERDLPPKNVLVKDESFLIGLTPELHEEFTHWVTIQTRDVFERTQVEVDAGSRIIDEPYLTRFQNEGYTFSFDVDDLAEPFTQPSLFLMGRQDWIVGYRDAWELVEHYPRASFGILDRAGHNLPIESEKLFDTLIHEWLDRVEEDLGE